MPDTEKGALVKQLNNIYSELRKKVDNGTANDQEDLLEDKILDLNIEDASIEDIKKLIKEYESIQISLTDEFKRIFESDKEKVTVSEPFNLNGYCKLKKIVRVSNGLPVTGAILEYNQLKIYYRLGSDKNKKTLLVDLYYLAPKLAKYCYKKGMDWVISEMDKKPVKDTYISTKKLENLEVPLMERINGNRSDLTGVKTIFTGLTNTLEYRIRLLGNLLIDILQIVQVPNNPNYYYLDVDKGYYVELDNMVLNKHLQRLFEDANLVTTELAFKSLEYVKNTTEKAYNVIAFKNCLYDISNFKKIDQPPVLLPHYTVNYNLITEDDIKFKEVTDPKTGKTDTILANENHKICDDFLTLTFGVDKQAFLEIFGYLFVSGNPREMVIFFTGLAGTGKSTVKDIINGIIPSVDKTYGEFKSRFGLSDIVGKQLINITDTETAKISDIKSFIAGEGQYSEKKGQDITPIPKEEALKLSFTGNNIPTIKTDDAMMDKLAIFHLKHKIRHTDTDKKAYYKEFLANTEAVEYLIYLGIKAYKELGNAQFTIQDKTIEYLKANTGTGAIYKALSDTIKVNYNTLKDNEDVVYVDDLHKIIIAYGDLNKITIERTLKGKVKNFPRLIKEFVGDTDYKGETERETNRRYYPNLSYILTDIKDVETGKTIKESVLSKDYYLEYYENNIKGIKLE